MKNINYPASDLHEMMVDATTFLSHLTPSTCILILVGVAAGFYLLTREKYALVVALTGALYMLPFLLTGKML